MVRLMGKLVLSLKCAIGGGLGITIIIRCWGHILGGILLAWSGQVETVRCNE